MTAVISMVAATLLGTDGSERVSAEQLASWMGTINYEVVTRIGGHIARVAVDGGAPDPGTEPYRPPRP